MEEFSKFNLLDIETYDVGLKLSFIEEQQKIIDTVFEKSFELIKTQDDFNKKCKQNNAINSNNLSKAKKFMLDVKAAIEKILIAF